MHVFAVFIERNPDGDLEFLVTAGAGAFLELGVLEVFIAITNGMFGSASNASANSRAHCLVQCKPKQLPTTLAYGVREAVGDQGDFLGATQQLSANVGLAVAIAVLATLFQAP